MSDAARGAASPSEAAAGAGRAAAEQATLPGTKLGEPSTPRPCGACHKCGAQVKDASRVLVCDTCGCRYVHVLLTRRAAVKPRAPRLFAGAPRL